jgi:hypothetical protein
MPPYGVNGVIMNDVTDTSQTVRNVAVSDGWMNIGGGHSGVIQTWR